MQVAVQRKARSQRAAHCHGQEAEHKVGTRTLLAEQEVGRRKLLLAGGAPGDGLCIYPAKICGQKV